MGLSDEGKDELYIGRMGGSACWPAVGTDSSHVAWSRDRPDAFTGKNSCVVLSLCSFVPCYGVFFVCFGCFFTQPEIIPGKSGYHGVVLI
jgi:hypothetical protein